jgi:hypothetical protein
MDIYEKARVAVKEAFLKGNWEPGFRTFQEFLEGDMKCFAKVPSPFVEWEEVFESVAKVTVFAMSMMPLSVNSSVYTPLTDDVTFYDVAEALMAAYVFGRFDARYMPRARIIMQRTGKRIDVAPLEKLLEGLGVMRGGMLTGVGQALAKALIYGATNRTSTVVESVYLSALIANTLLAEIKRFNEESVRMFLLETTERHKRISSTVREWQKNAPKLYLRDVPIHYNWEDAVKDVALMLADKKDFRFTI